jgi:hypothetical protein
MRFAAALILASFSLGAHATPPLDAQEALARHRSALGETLQLNCGRNRDRDEILVCGKRERSPYRLPFDPEPEPGARRVGEAVDQREVMALNPERCPPIPQRPQSEDLDLLAMAVTVVTVAVSLAEGGLEPAQPRPVKNCG